MKSFGVPLPVLVLLVACTSSPRETSDTSQSRIVDAEAIARIDSTLQALVDEHRVAGISALIFEKGSEVYYNAFGYADREAGVPMERNTLVRIYSMTKPVTGVALMQLYEEGLFQLDDALERHLPEFANLRVYGGLDTDGQLVLEPPHRPVTVRDITRHTSGFVTWSGKPGLDSMIRAVRPMAPENTLKQVAEELARLPLAFHPGEQWGYGPSVDVQARLVEKLSGKVFAAYLRENIFKPLGMNETRYFIPEEDRSRFAAIYNRGADGLTRVPDDTANALNTRRWPLTPGGYGLTSTLDDYMRFARMLLNEGSLDGVSVLKPETVQLMATNQLADSVTERMWLPGHGQVGFGIDFAVRVRPPADSLENNGVVGEFFWNGAATTLFWVDPANALTAVLFLQVFPFDMQVHKDFRDAVYGAYRPVEGVTASLQEAP